VHRTAQRRTTKKALVAEVDLWVTPTKEKLASRLAREIADILGISGKAREIARVFGSLRVRPTVTVQDDGSFGFTFAAGHTAEDVDDTLEGLFRVLVIKDHGFVVISEPFLAEWIRRNAS